MSSFSVITNQHSYQLYYRLPLLEGDDYHEFIVKQEKKLKISFRKKFAFAKPFQTKVSGWGGGADDSVNPESKDFWKPSHDSFAGKKKLIL